MDEMDLVAVGIGSVAAIDIAAIIRGVDGAITCGAIGTILVIIQAVLEVKRRRARKAQVK